MKRERNKVFSFDYYSKQVFDGIMISDGSIESLKYSARLTLGFKYEETLDRIISDIKCLNFGPKTVVKSIRLKNEITNFFTKSKCYINLTEEKNRWYKDKKKIVPKDIIFDHIFCYWWYVCDGFKYDKQYVHLCTDSFSNEDNSWLCSKLNQMDFNCSVNSRNRIIFKKASSLNFLNYIRRAGVQKEYEYKF